MSHKNHNAGFLKIFIKRIKCQNTNPAAALRLILIFYLVRTNGSPVQYKFLEILVKKTLIALAVLGSIAGVAQAQSSVTIYGVVDVALSHENNGTTSVTRMDSGQYSSSRLGFKGTEDLGGGISAIFQFESGFNADTGAQTDPVKLFNRQSFVGLTGNFGALKLGRQKNPVYGNLDTIDPLGDNLTGAASRLFNYSGNRTDNLITYAYAAQGFRGELQYGLGELPDNTAGRTAAGFVGYKNGPIDVVLTHQNIRTTADILGTQMTLLGGNYNFGVVKAFASYAWEKGAVDQRDALIGLTAPVGAAGTFRISYIRKTDKAFDNRDAQQIAVAYTHDLSKRTSLYTGYSQLRNDDAANFRTNTATAPAPANGFGNTDKLFTVGLRHQF